MKQLFVSDELWGRIEPHLPAHKPRPKGGRKPKPDRGCLEGLLFVLRTGIQWEHLPQELGWGSGMTCWRRMRDWQEAGVWDRVQEELLADLREGDQLDLSRVSLDSSSIRAKKRGRRLARAR